MQKKGNSFIILTTLSSFLIPMFFNEKIYINFLFLFCATIIMLYFGLKISNFIKISLFLFPITSTIILMNIIYPNIEALNNTEKIKFLNFYFYKEALYNGIVIFIKLFGIGAISISSILIIDIYELFYILMQNFGLSKKIAYPFFISLNSISHVKDEYERIILLRKLRKIRKFNIFTLFLPILVFAIRFSERSSMALVAKGFNENVNNFYFPTFFDKRLFKRTITFSLLIFLIFIILTIFFNY
ncbi:MAG: energy-coupling factor transporter transmembrane protein EcfT [Spirochaetes bacterium]|nr:energy-coupling factor transporter transmembrane protein EcfT [Spirochaetota bacterium]